ncbi:MAG: hypothetical protein Q8P77_01695 [Candidatus Veblenbacteria bacterium]|nr:hypothetical protein [Candidatus Veblenbacteria bacterium]
MHTHSLLLRSLLAFALLVLPVVVLAQATNTELQNPLGEGVGPWELFARLAGGLSFVTGTLALAFTVIGGYVILTAAGNSERFSTGKKMVTYSIIGMLLATASYTILSTAINVLTGAAVGKGVLTEFKSATTLIDPLGLMTLPDGAGPAFIFYGQRILGFVVNLLGVAVVIMYVYGGLTWMLSAGNEERIATAKRTLLYATLGAAVVLSSYILIKFIYVPFASLLQAG